MIGNEAGWAGETNWLTDERGYAPESNGMYGTEDGWQWDPGESDAKLTDKGWFWHEGEKPLSVERLFQMYLETVGRNATLILNCPPDKSGQLPEIDVRVLKDMGNMIRTRLGKDLAQKAKVTVSNTRKAGANRNYAAKNLTDNNKNTYWATDDGVKQATITFNWDKPQTVRYVDMMEYIRKGQRVRKFHIEISEDGKTWKPIAEKCTTTTIGYKRIIPLNGSTSDSYGKGYQVKGLKVVIDDSKACPLLHSIKVF